MSVPKATCPQCGAHAGVMLIWGKPRGDAAEKMAQGELVCGGCDIWVALEGVLANHECLVCGHQWYLPPVGGAA